MFKRLSGSGRPDRIRKDAGELRVADFERFPVWEFCLDEEGRPGQTECTMRPRVGDDPIQWPQLDGLIAATMRLASGKELFGTIHPQAESCGNPTKYDPEIWLDRPAGEYVQDPVMKGYNQIVRDTSHRIGFTIADRKHLPDDEAKKLIAIAYKVFGVTAEQMWPVAVIPRVPVVDWPRSWEFEGWTRVSDFTVLR